MKPELESIKALTFDVFGTVVDFRGSIIRECRAFGKARGLRVNWPKFTDARRWTASAAARCRGPGSTICTA
jgi:2-haloacid dehalogenase